MGYPQGFIYKVELFIKVKVQFFIEIVLPNLPKRKKVRERNVSFRLILKPKICVFGETSNDFIAGNDRVWIGFKFYLFSNIQIHKGIY